MRYTTLLALACIGCDMGVQERPTSQHGNADSTACCTQYDDDARNCEYTTTDSTWVETCISGDTTIIAVEYSEWYYEKRGSDKKGIDLFVIVGNDTTKTEIE